MRLLLDQDSVLADTMSKVFETVRAEMGVELCHADTKDYWFKDMSVPASYLLDIMRRPGFYLDLEVVSGAIQAVRRLREQYDVVVCTQPINNAPTCEDEKREWLARHFDADFAEEAIVTTDKTLVLGRALVEDNPHISRTASWQPIMFTQRWNRDVADLPRMNGWGDLDVIDRAML